jgi:hypothetical protein
VAHDAAGAKFLTRRGQRVHQAEPILRRSSKDMPRASVNHPIEVKRCSYDRGMEVLVLESPAMDKRDQV